MSNKISKKKQKNTPRPNNKTVAKLLVDAGGRCSFNGCNEYLLKDGLTLREYNHSNVAHIVALQKNGPRGDSELTTKERNKIDNLMLTCLKHHSLIDKKELVKKYPVSLLKKYKKEHEDRIFRLTGLSPERKTKVITFKFKIGNELVKISNEDIYEAIHPYYPMEKEIKIDCTIGDLGTKKYYECITEHIKKSVEEFNVHEDVKHVSVFALAPIPLLVYLGNSLSNKVKLELFQRHRTVPETWEWTPRQKESKFELEKINENESSDEVGLVLELSGEINLSTIPKSVLNTYPVYKIKLKDEQPAPTFLKSKKTLNNFKDIYQSALRKINNGGKVKKIHLFPAVPAPIAVLCGREMLKKIDPDILIYDNNRSKGGFYKVLKINNK